MVAQSIAAVKPVSALVRAVQRFFRSHENGNVRAAQFRGVKCIASGLLDGNVSSNGGDGQHTHAWGAERHDQSYGVIGSGVGVNQEEGFHAA